MSRRLAAVGMILALVPASAYAETDVIKFSESAPDMVQVDLPETVRPASMTVSAEPSGISLEITGSTFAPTDFELQSRVAGATPFSGTGIPELGLGVRIPLKSGRWGVIATQLGARFLQLARTGTFLGAGFSQPETEYLGVIPVHAGLDVTPRFLQWRLLSFHFGAALLPTVAMSTRTVFDDGVVAFGVPVTVSAGMTIHLKSFGLRADAMSVYGNVGEGQMSGSGGILSLDVPL